MSNKSCLDYEAESFKKLENDYFNHLELCGPDKQPPLLEIYFSIEPRLVDVFKYVMRPERKNEEWEDIYSYAKTHFNIDSLVGWNASAISLRTSEAYEFVIKSLVDIIWDNSKDDSINIDNDDNG